MWNTFLCSFRAACCVRRLKLGRGRNVLTLAADTSGPTAALISTPHPQRLAQRNCYVGVWRDLIVLRNCRISWFNCIVGSEQMYLLKNRGRWLVCSLCECACSAFFVWFFLLFFVFSQNIQVHTWHNMMWLSGTLVWEMVHLPSCLQTQTNSWKTCRWCSTMLTVTR